MDGLDGWMDGCLSYPQRKWSHIFSSVVLPLQFSMLKRCLPCFSMAPKGFPDEVKRTLKAASQMSGGGYATEDVYEALEEQTNLNRKQLIAWYALTPIGSRLLHYNVQFETTGLIERGIRTICANLVRRKGVHNLRASTFQ